ncbi:30S ribosomal protein S21 [Candidatus Peregrinibacteria bacterium]|jgi:ribosomal protein S21|nr:30S ribosomal protein S21 [Candidatus Peregrinibacteria bacterium]
MAIKVVRNPKESVDRLIARFNKKVQSSRVIVKLKARRYFKRPLRKREVRAAAIMRQHYRSVRDKMKFY